MTTFPSLIRCVSSSGVVRYRLGDRLVDRYLEFVAGRARPNTLRAVAFDLKTFFMVVGKDPVEVDAADVFAGDAAGRAAPLRGARAAVR
jgi:integrase/recombinase XerD